MMSRSGSEQMEVPDTPSILTAVLFEEGADEPRNEFTLCHLRFSIAGESVFAMSFLLQCNTGSCL